jgi:hypothetical protein
VGPLTTHVRLANDTALRSALGTLEALRPLLKPGSDREALAAVLKGLLVAIRTYEGRLAHERGRLGQEG